MANKIAEMHCKGNDITCMCPCEDGTIPDSRPGAGFVICDACKIGFMAASDPGEIVTDHHSSTMALADGLAEMLRAAGDEADEDERANNR